jgi:hypothetical protein
MASGVAGVVVIPGAPVGGIREVGVGLTIVPTAMDVPVRSGVGVPLIGSPAPARAVCVARACNIRIGSVTGGLPVAVGVGIGAVDADRWHAARKTASTMPTARIEISFLDMSILLVREPVFL